MLSALNFAISEKDVNRQQMGHFHTHAASRGGNHGIINLLILNMYIMKRCLNLLLLFSLCIFPFKGNAQVTNGELGKLITIQDDVKSRRISSADKTGNNGDCVGQFKPGEKWSIEVPGTGIINHIWFTIAPTDISRNDLIFRIYWDGNSFPSVESPIGPFFGNGWNEHYEFVSMPLACGPRDATGLTCYFQMPFEKGARIEIENQSDKTLTNLYFYVDYTEMDKLPKGAGRFHAWDNHETTDALPEGETEWGLVGTPGYNKDGANNYVFADIKGHGHFVGINYYVHSPSPMWYGEGDDMIFIDGEAKSSINGTGTEDFFNTSWCPNSYYMHPYYGYPRVNNDNGWLGRTHLYRFFIADPIYFKTAFKGTIEHGHNNNLTLDLSSVAYWYQSEASMLPPAPSKADRQPKAFIRDQDMHRWRHEWRKNFGNGSKLWGNEVKE